MLLAFAIAFLIILASQPLMKKYGPKPPEPASVPLTQQAAQQPSPPQPGAGQPVPGGNTSATPHKPAVTKQAETESEFVVENDLYKIRFTNRGGLVKSWILKRFADDKGQPLELVNAAAAAKYGLPLSLFTYDALL